MVSPENLYKHTWDKTVPTAVQHVCTNYLKWFNLFLVTSTFNVSKIKNWLKRHFIRICSEHLHAFEIFIGSFFHHRQYGLKAQERERRPKESDSTSDAGLVRAASVSHGVGGCNPAQYRGGKSRAWET